MNKNLRKSIYILSSGIILFSTIACKNTSETKLVFSDNDTIKQSVKDREQGITWTQELEKDRLSQTITRNSIELGLEVPYTKEVFKINKSNQSPVYPEYSDFGSLDTRNIRPSIKEKMNNFCSSLSSENHNGADAFFSRKYIFNYVFFIKDLEEGWKINFEEDYPEKINEEGLFTKWTFGEPFIGSEIMQIPVRFYTTCGIIDITVFLNSSGNNDIYQITINRWKKV